MKIGAEELTFKAESKKALDVELLLLHVALFAVVFAYAFDYIAWPLFLVLFYAFYSRFFISNHDRMHADTSRRWPRVVEFIAEKLAVCVVPWREPYDSVRKKHMTHHATHRPGKTPVLDTRNDPHMTFEIGFLRSLLSSIFFEEVQLYFDIRKGELAQSRWFNLIVYLPLQILFVVNFGWGKYLVVLLGVRFTSAVSWFVFSWGIHTPFVYRWGFKTQVPLPFHWALGVSNGIRTMHGLFRHTSHHAWPSLPHYRLDDFDSAVLRNPEAAPEMIPSGR